MTAKLLCPHCWHDTFVRWIDLRIELYENGEYINAKSTPDLTESRFSCRGCGSDVALDEMIRNDISPVSDGEEPDVPGQLLFYWEQPNPAVDRQKAHAEWIDSPDCDVDWYLSQHDDEMRRKYGEGWEWTRQRVISESGSESDTDDQLKGGDG